MKNKVFEFTKFRYIAPIASLTVIVIFFIITGVRGGFNLGIDFLSGLNMRVQIAPTAVQTNISDIRTVLSPVGSTQIQVVGDASAQEFSIRVRETVEQTGVAVSDRVKGLLQAKYGAANVIIKQSEFSGPRFSQALSFQAIWLIVCSLALMLIYIWFRFKLAYGVSSILALTHDALIMVATIGCLQLEVDVTTIAAVLTIIGYSLNATIVIFDRVKENIILLKDKPIRQIIDTSVSQSLSRGIITSFTTLIAVVAIYVFGVGVIKNFAFNLIVGICVGTYSSFFIAPSLLYIWMAKIQKKKYSKEMILAADAPAAEIPAAVEEVAEKAAEVEEKAESAAENAVEEVKEEAADDADAAAVAVRKRLKGTRRDRIHQMQKIR
ncbi:MAG: protein translocase subunit SecF [Spirochaetia bacterium]|nr:protein translocase subunit SecF [Spirochaetia bacterium]